MIGGSVWDAFVADFVIQRPVEVALWFKFDAVESLGWDVAVLT